MQFTNKPRYIRSKDFALHKITNIIVLHLIYHSKISRIFGFFLLLFIVLWLTHTRCVITIVEFWKKDLRYMLLGLEWKSFHSKIIFHIAKRHSFRVRMSVFCMSHSTTRLYNEFDARKNQSFRSLFWQYNISGDNKVR